MLNLTFGKIIKKLFWNQFKFAGEKYLTNGEKSVVEEDWFYFALTSYEEQVSHPEPIVSVPEVVVHATLIRAFWLGKLRRTVFAHFFYQNLSFKKLAVPGEARSAKTGAEGRTRTGTGKPPKDFKSFASTNSATSAYIYIEKFGAERRNRTIDTKLFRLLLYH